MHTKRSLLAITVAATLAACGSDDTSSTDTTNEGAATTSLTAKAADGYLVGANACLDLNGDKVCNDDEPSSVTGDGGEFTISGITQEQLEQGVILIEIVENQTIDLDNPDVTLAKSYTLTAPPGSDFISPITTLLQNEIENGSSVEEATAKIKTQLGTSLDITEDYVEAKSSDDYSAEEQAAFENLHRISQVTAGIMADNTDALEAAASGAGISVEQLTSLILEEVTQVISNIVQQVEQYADQDEFDSSSIATSIGSSLIDLDQDNLEEKIEENEATKNSSAANLGALVASEGINWFWSEQEGNTPRILEFGQLKLNSDDSISDTEYEFDYKTAKFVVLESNGENEGVILSSNGWVDEDDAVESIEINDEGSILLVMATPELSEIAEAEQVDISGLSVSTVLSKTGGDGIWGEVVSEDLNFPADTTAYKVEFEATVDGYYAFNKGDWCDNREALNGACNSVLIDGSYAQTLADTLATDSADRTGSTNYESLISVIGWNGGNVMAQLLENGSVYYYHHIWVDGSLEKLEEEGNWRDIEVNGETLREVASPSVVYEDYDYSWSSINDDDGKFYLALYNDFVRVSHYEENEASDAEYIFDTATVTFILDNYTQPMTLASCLAELPDADYEAEVGDKHIYDVDFNDTDREYEFTYLGSNFSWLTETNVVDLPAVLSEGELTKTEVLGRDEDGNDLFVEDQYSNQNYYFGQYGETAAGDGTWGQAKAVLPEVVNNDEILLGVETVYGQSANVSLANINSAPENSSYMDLNPVYFDYTQVYLGKEKITVEAGTFYACKVYSETTFASSEIPDVSTVWINNRGTLLQERSEPSWGAEIELEATAIPSI
ncbi:hypothetical protein J4N42_08015 [Vibrio sp. SCSIO 43135]|uniref:hypothetical protein n=1 Tax=Vibrio sp. SCSIO 43135 TaxID=2819096 RepID=UPI002075A1BB|nr:hypothetical protein [Vibrio sp. SCSIO 43135]USD40024.1 hypothetical protein J4N42_08015 [Vibrio sp. SCSIO 43135]